MPCSFGLLPNPRSEVDAHPTGCPDDPSILPEHVGRQNFCIDVSLQAFKDRGNGAVRVGPKRAVVALHLGS
jgi:hypothetical protein